MPTCLPTGSGPTADLPSPFMWNYWRVGSICRNVTHRTLNVPTAAPDLLDFQDLWAQPWTKWISAPEKRTFMTVGTVVLGSGCQDKWHRPVHPPPTAKTPTKLAGTAKRFIAMSHGSPSKAWVVHLSSWRTRAPE